MGKRGHSEEGILRVLRVAECGDSVMEICRKHRISQQTFLPLVEEIRGSWVERVAGAAAVTRGEREAEAASGRPEPGSACLAGDRGKKTIKPRARRELAEWAQQVHRMSQRRVAGLIRIERMTLRYEHHRDTSERPCLRHSLELQ
jgi:hypothetical protein